LYHSFTENPKVQLSRFYWEINKKGNMPMIQPMLPPDIPLWISKMLPQNNIRYTIDVSGQAMHVMECGDGMPVLMLHGNPTWGFLYRRVIGQLSGNDFRCIVPDLIGLGFSSKPQSYEFHTLENHARWIGSLIDQLDLEGLIFVGQDWGGPIGLRALSERRDLIKGMVILNTVVSPPRPNFKPTAFHRFSQVPLISNVVFRFLGFPQSILSMVQGNPASISGNIASAYRYPLKRYKENIAPLALARMVPDSMFHPSVSALKECQDLVESYKGPAEIVWGDKDPILGRAFKRVASFLPDAGITRTKAGHFLQEEVPDEIARAIRNVSKQIS
jgi:haloalkane dehalogenase